MNSKDQNMQTAAFVEFLAVPQAQAKNPLLDIIIEGKITLQNYCNALIAKLLKINHSEIPAFIEYQCNHAKNAEVWICKLEKLLANNEAVFSSKTELSRYNKLYILIEKKRTELQSLKLVNTKPKTPKRLINANSDDRYFSYFEVKNHIETLTDFTEKLIYLTQEAFEYKQADKFSINTTLQPYDEQCNHQIEHLQTLRKMRSEFDEEQKEKLDNAKLAAAPKFKIRLNGPINILTDAYKQMMYEVKPNGKPYIEYKIKEIAKFICDNYLDENGNELSMLTIQTYLSPTRTDKNPNNDWKIKL